MNTGFISIKDIASLVATKDVDVFLVESKDMIHITVIEHNDDNSDVDDEHN